MGLSIQQNSLQFIPARNPEEQVPLCLFSSRVRAGFPSPADDYIESNIDLNEWLIQNRLATSIVRVEGDSMSGEIHSGDRLIIDRSLEPKNNDVVLASIDGEVTVKRLVLQDGRPSLVPENPSYSAIEIHEEDDFSIWGVVTYCIHRVR